jgi:xanthine/uracil permease
VFELTDASKPFLLVGAAITLAIVVGLRRWSPGKRWLALLLAILFGPAGHLYLKGGARYILLMYAAWFGLLVATPLPPIVSGLLLTVLSALLMNVRIQNAAKPKSA